MYCLALLSLGLASVHAIPVKRAGRTSPPSGCKVVRASGAGSGEYSSLSAAVASLSGTAAACIFMYSGTYTDQVTIEYGGALTLYGYTSE